MISPARAPARFASRGSTCASSSAVSSVPSGGIHTATAAYSPAIQTEG